MGGDLSVRGWLCEKAPADQRGEMVAKMYVVSDLAFSLPALAAGLADERFRLEPTAVSYAVDALSVLTAAPWLRSAHRAWVGTSGRGWESVASPRREGRGTSAGKTTAPVGTSMTSLDGSEIRWLTSVMDSQYRRALVVAVRVNQYRATRSSTVSSADGVPAVAEVVGPFVDLLAELACLWRDRVRTA
jgi:hypothetical protein